MRNAMNILCDGYNALKDLRNEEESTLKYLGLDGIESIERVIIEMKHLHYYEDKQLLRDYLQQLKGGRDNNQQQPHQRSNNPLKNLIGWIKSPKDNN
ncbi:hypothetical protein DFA_04336 [Cavenderia fasciculata]|uniref:Uncharacterized protein n=1 Tax=Cavenderia fasciculata TaxID=261658 RepID=F4PPA5_CACFS|nr:uncharacterized protein DFA_04336 [Cavenderia fasciculata]EGG22218.1 hypothetical protein DFA_04336 [Cavenderia fasciculata]|eukprot:XP_004360069.1 hypothetical protein DFA_04336 [Cavenderia fasciculata]